MINKILLLVVFTLCVVVGFSIWYLTFWFITKEQNLFLWIWWIKIIYLLLSFNTTNNIIDFVNKN